MSEELAVIPRGELARALRVTTRNVRSTTVIVVTGAVAMVSAFIFGPFDLVLNGCLFLYGATAAGLGGVYLTKALRARETVRNKLRAQKLPSARLLERQLAVSRGCRADYSR